MDLIESIPQVARWIKTKEMAFGGLDPLYRFQGKRILFDHPENYNTGITADVFLISKIKNKNWIWGWSVKFPVEIDNTTIKGVCSKLNCKNNYPMKSAEDEYHLLQIVCEALSPEIIMELSLFSGPNSENATYYIGLTNVVITDVSKRTCSTEADSMMVGIPVQQSCSVCNKEGNMKRCTKCKDTLYCSSECQLRDWKEHKKICTSK